MFISKYKRCKCVGGETTLSFHNEDIDSAGNLLQLVAVPSRLKLLLLLAKGPHCVCDLTKHTKLSQTLVSHHLSDLSKAGIVSSAKDGQFMIYRLTAKGSETINKLKSIINLQKKHA